MPLELENILFDLGIPSGILIAFIVIQFPIWVCSVVHVASKKTKEPTDRIVWLLVILFLGILGTILYFAFGREGKVESEIDSNKEAKDFENWKKGDSSRAFLNAEDQRAAFEDFKSRNNSNQ